MEVPLRKVEDIRMPQLVVWSQPDSRKEGTGRAVERTDLHGAMSLKLEHLEPRLLLSGGPAVSSAAAEAVQQWQGLASMPVSFVENVGQIPDASVRYAFYGDGANILHTIRGPVFEVFGGDRAAGAPADSPTIESREFSVTFVGADRVEPVGESRQEAVVNYLLGQNAEDWHTNVPTYAEVVYAGLYQGIDLHTFGQPGQLKYEFHVAAGADATQIAVRYDGIDGLSIDDTGNLLIATPMGELTDAAPVMYQEVGGVRQPVAGAFVLQDANTYTIAVTGAYDSSLPLVIDPAIDWSGVIYAPSADNYGDFGELLVGVGCDRDGNVYFAGQTGCNDFPTRNGYDNSFNGTRDAFVIKISPAGALLWSTFLGGLDNEQLRGFAVDPNGGAVLAGWTLSSDFPTASAPQLLLEGGCSGFLTRFNSSGTLAWSTYMGSRNHLDDVAVDSGGYAYVLGDPGDPIEEFPGLPVGYKENYKEDAVLVKVSPTGPIQWVKFIENEGYGDDDYEDIAVSRTGDEIFVTGHLHYHTQPEGWPLEGAFDSVFAPPGSGLTTEGFVMKFGSNGAREWSSFIGGSDNDGVQDVAVDAQGNAVLVGYTYSDDFPGVARGFDSTRNRQDGFVAKVSGGGSLLWSTYLGGQAGDTAWGVATDALGNIFVTGSTFSDDFTTENAFYRSFHPAGNPFLTRLNAGGGRVYSSYLGSQSRKGGDGYAVATGSQGAVYVLGEADEYWDGSKWRGGHFLSKVVEEPAEWTVMVYANADNNLENSRILDLRNMERVDLAGLSGGKVKLLIQLDRSNGFDTTPVGPDGDWTDTRRGEVIHDENDLTFASQLESIGEANMGDPATLVDFIEWGMATAPANHYAVVLSDHGGGWQGLSYDHSPRENMVMPGLAAAFDQVPYVDVLVFHMCMMQMVEVATELAGEVGYTVASEESTSSGTGEGSLINYQGWIDWLARNPDAEPVDFARQVFLKDTNKVCSVVDMASIPILNAQLDSFAGTILAEACPHDYLHLCIARGDSRWFSNPHYYDLGGFFVNIVRDTVDFSTSAIPNAALDALDGVHAAVLEHKGARTYGLSIYLARGYDKVYGAYNPNQLTFCDPANQLGTRWRECVYRMQGQQLPEAPVADVGNSPAQAHAVAAPAGTQACVDSAVDTPQDVDFVSFSATAGQLFTAEAYGNAQAGGLQPVLTLYAPNRSTVVTQATGDDDGHAGITRRTLTQTGTYYLAVSSAGNTTPLNPAGGTTSGAYSLSLLRGDASAVNPVLSLDNNSVVFGDAEMNAWTSRPLVVTNTGGSDLTITALNLPAGSVFMAPYVPTPLPLTLGAGESRDFGVAVCPAALGPVAATLHILSDDPAHGDVTVALQATGIEPGLDVPIGTGGASTALFTDADGTAVTLAFKGGTGFVHLRGQNLQRTNKGATATITGQNVAMHHIELNGATTASTLAVTTKGGTIEGTSVGEILVNGSLKSLNGKLLDLSGNLTVSGSLGSLVLDDAAQGSTIWIGPRNPGDIKTTLTATLDRVADLSLESDTPIKSLTMTDWLDTDATPDHLWAPWLGTLSVKGNKKLPGVRGDFMADLTMMGGEGLAAGKAALGSASVAGDLSARLWDVNGMGGLTVKGWTVGPNHATPFQIRSLSSMGALTLGAVDSVDFLAGIRPAEADETLRHAAVQGDFLNLSASIKSLTITGFSLPKGVTPLDYFVNSNFSAASIGAVKLVNIEYDNSKTMFGLWVYDAGTGKEIKSVKVTNLVDKTSWTWPLKAGQAIPDGDFTIQVC